VRERREKMPKKSARRAPGMIFIEDKSTSLEVAARKKIIEETQRLKDDSEATPIVMDVKAFGYDGVFFTFKTSGDKHRECEVSMTADVVSELMKYGGEATMEDIYEKYKPTVDGNTVTLKFDADDLPEDAEVVVDKIANLKRNLYGAPFDSCFHALKEDGVKLDPIAYEYRKDGLMFLVPSEDNVAIIFQMYYPDETDQELAKILLNEFTEVQRSVNSSPATMFFEGKAPPAAKEVKSDIPNEKNSFFLQILVTKTHLKTEKQQKRVTSLLINIRTYMLYHMKCTKAYVMSRMRTKYDNLIKSLNRCKPLDRKKIGSKSREI